MRNLILGPVALIAGLCALPVAAATGALAAASGSYICAIGENGETEDIEGLSSNDKNIFLYGTQDQETWNATISLENGALTGGISSGTSSFALFGNCTKK
jgi:hypothetical protein